MINVFTFCVELQSFPIAVKPSASARSMDDMSYMSAVDNTWTQKSQSSWYHTADEGDITPVPAEDETSLTDRQDTNVSSTNISFDDGDEEELNFDNTDFSSEFSATEEVGGASSDDYRLSFYLKCFRFKSFHPT